jgi:hypothetical protein
VEVWAKIPRVSAEWSATLEMENDPVTTLNARIPVETQELIRELASDEVEVVSGGDAVGEAMGAVVATTAIVVCAMAEAIANPHTTYQHPQ